MSLNVQLNKSTPTNFRLVFPVIPGNTTLEINEELVLNIHGIVLPGVSLEPLEMGYNNTKSKLSMGPMLFEEFAVDFLVDSQFKNWKLIFNWISYMNNNKDKGNLPHNEFVVDMSLQVLDNFQDEILRVAFVRCWPTQLAAVNFSQREGEAALECNAVFNFDYYEIKT